MDLTLENLLSALGEPIGVHATAEAAAEAIRSRIAADYIPVRRNSPDASRGRRSQTFEAHK
ncbi:hypothetical protein ACFPIF_15470 [Brevundimonas faecalis]|uniref:hypothetical protein n=1 Tax=Brevundimonas faecalis TaxID=947378 RepID=UPI003623EF40